MPWKKCCFAWKLGGDSIWLGKKLDLGWEGEYYLTFQFAYLQTIPGGVVLLGKYPSMGANKGPYLPLDIAWRQQEFQASNAPISIYHFGWE